MNLLKAPIDALYSRKFYKQVTETSLVKGFLYLAYLGLIFSILTTGVFLFRGVPQIDAFVEWIKQEMPPLTLTPEGLVMDAQSPYDMIHPDYAGLMITFDTTVDEVSSEEMGDAVIFVTAKRVYIRQAQGEVRVYDLTQAAEDVAPDRQAVAITPELVDKVYNAFKPVALILVLVFFFPFFYIWKLLTALFYFLFALIINLFRTTRLEYSKLLNVSLFAITASTLIQFRGVVWESLARVLPYPFFLSFLVTMGYLFVGVKLTESDTDPLPPSV